MFYVFHFAACIWIYVCQIPVFGSVAFFCQQQLNFTTDCVQCLVIGRRHIFSIARAEALMFIAGCITFSSVSVNHECCLSLCYVNVTMSVLLVHCVKLQGSTEKDLGRLCI